MSELDPSQPYRYCVAWWPTLSVEHDGEVPEWDGRVLPTWAEAENEIDHWRRRWNTKQAAGVVLLERNPEVPRMVWDRAWRESHAADYYLTGPTLGCPDRPEVTE